MIDKDLCSALIATELQAACAFVQATGQRAVIGALGSIEALLAGTAGTQISTVPG